MALLTPDQIEIARRGDVIDYGAFTYLVGPGTFRVGVDGFETKKRVELYEHIFGLVMEHNPGPTTVGHNMTHKNWANAKQFDTTECPEDLRHILDYFPDAVFVVYTAPWYGFGGWYQPPTWALKLKAGGFWYADALLASIEATEPNTSAGTRRATILGMLYGQLELMGGLKEIS